MRNFFSFILSRSDRKTLNQFIIIACVSILANILAVAIPVFQKRIIDSITKVQPDSTLFILFLSAGIMLAVVSVIEALVLNGLFKTVQNRIAFELLTSVTRQDNEIIKQRGAGAYMVSMFGNSEQIGILMNTNYFSILLVCISTIATLVISYKWSWIFPLIVVSSYIIMFAIIKISNKIYVRNYTQARELVYEVNPKVLEFIENRKTIMSYSDVMKFENDTNDVFLKRDKLFTKALAANVFAKSAVSAIKNIALTIFFIFSMVQILNHQLELSSFIAMISYFALVFAPVSSIQELYTNMNQFENMYDRIKENLLVPPSIRVPKNNTMKFENCSFSYSEKNDIIRDFNLILDKKTGLVGLSGEGKSTILKMLFGEVKPISGSVKYGDMDVGDIPKPLLFSNIRYYAQELELFNDTLEFNITLGKKGLNEREYRKELEKIENKLEELINKIKSLKHANDFFRFRKENKELFDNIFSLNKSYLNKDKVIKEIITKIQKDEIVIDAKVIAPVLISREYYITEKYETIINELGIGKLVGRKLGQRGSDVSGGEKNKICLARFILPEHNGPFVIDEPFTSLDLFSEEENLKVLKKYIKNSNGIIISHKMNVIKELTDEIIVIENGEIAEKGTHEELMENDALYGRLQKKFTEMKIS